MAIREVMIKRELNENGKILKLAKNHIKNDISSTPRVFEKIQPRSINREKIREVNGKTMSPRIK
jgi:hypothetical protein